MTADKPWRDRETLRHLYVDQGLTMKEVASRLGCGASTVGRHLEKNGIRARQPGEWALRGPASFSTDANGYERCRSQVNGERSIVRTHRLVAIAYGADPYMVFGGDHDIHHKNGVPFDNRPSNLELLPTSEHVTEHNLERYSGGPWRDKQTLSDAYQDATMEELADEWGCSPSTIGHWLRKHGIEARPRGPRPDNIEVMTISEHVKHHHREDTFGGK